MFLLFKCLCCNPLSLQHNNYLISGSNLAIHPPPSGIGPNVPKLPKQGPTKPVPLALWGDSPDHVFFFWAHNYNH